MLAMVSLLSCQDQVRKERVGLRKGVQAIEVAEETDMKSTPPNAVLKISNTGSTEIQMRLTSSCHCVMLSASDAVLTLEPRGQAMVIVTLIEDLPEDVVPGIWLENVSNAKDTKFHELGFAK